MLFAFLIPGLSFGDIHGNDDELMKFAYLIEDIVSTEWIYQLREHTDRILADLQNFGAKKIKEVILLSEEAGAEDSIQTQSMYKMGFLDSSNECFIYNNAANEIRKCEIKEKHNISHLNTLGLIREAQAADSNKTEWTGCEIAVAVGAILGAIAIIVGTGGQIITIGAQIGAALGLQYGMIAGIIVGLIGGIIAGADLNGLEGAFFGTIPGALAGGVLGTVVGTIIFAVAGVVVAVGLGASTGAGIAYLFCED